MGGTTYGGYVEWRDEPAFARDGLPNDPAADSLEAILERRAREWAVACAVWSGTVTRAEVQAYPFPVFYALQSRKPALTWVKVGAFYVRLLADDESLPGGRTLADALCEYLNV
jgi:hypothetical protein